MIYNDGKCNQLISKMWRDKKTGGVPIGIVGHDWFDRSE